MYRFLGFVISAAGGGWAGWNVYINLIKIMKDFYKVLGFSIGVFLVVTLILYLPLFKHLADLVEEWLSTQKVKITARKTGLGFDEVPMGSAGIEQKHIKIKAQKCDLCSGPGGPICEKCHARMSKM